MCYQIMHPHQTSRLRLICQRHPSEQTPFFILGLFVVCETLKNWIPDAKVQPIMILSLIYSSLVHTTRLAGSVN